MKKIKSVVVLMIVALFAFSALSCSSDDKPEAPTIDRIEGEWYMSSDKGYFYWEDGEKEVYDDTYTRATSPLILTFAKEGVCLLEIIDDGETVRGVANWEIKGNKIILGETTETEGLELVLSGGKLTSIYKGVDEDGPYEERIVFTKSR